ncbi:uncharacterized protein [Palaemon carinicauda]|uniref:uncharacterized protein n=1 Tax=Palaemon carinicauda TaxID=392227 RepID=UPI0035B65369
MRNTPPTRLPIQLDNTIIDRLGYADDVDLCGEHLPSIEETYVQFKNSAERTGMKINNAKTKIMEVSRTPNLVGDMDFGGSQLEAVSTFEYLGSTITSHNTIQEEVHVLIIAYGIPSGPVALSVQVASVELNYLSVKGELYEFSLPVSDTSEVRRKLLEAQANLARVQLKARLDAEERAAKKKAEADELAAQRDAEDRAARGLADAALLEAKLEVQRQQLEYEIRLEAGKSHCGSEVSSHAGSVRVPSVKAVETEHESRINQ